MRRIVANLIGGALVAASPALAAGEDLTAPGPEGPLAGTLVLPAAGSPIVLIVPGSGPTDRDGNNTGRITAGSYRLLAEALADRGIGTLRIDKRGLFGSKAATADPNAVTLDAYADDVAAWVDVAREATGVPCVWLLGHSEGGLIALVAARRVEQLCGIILVAAPGETLGEVLRTQLRANPANAPILPQALGAIEALEKGERVDTSGFHPALRGLFNPAVQGFLVDMMARDPAALAGQVTLPMLIVQGGKDLHIPRANGDALHAAQPAAEYLVIPAMNHVLKDIAGDTPQANMAAYADPALPVAPELVDAITGFVARPPVGKGDK